MQGRQCLNTPFLALSYDQPFLIILMDCLSLLKRKWAVFEALLFYSYKIALDIRRQNVGKRTQNRQLKDKKTRAFSRLKTLVLIGGEHGIRTHETVLAVYTISKCFPYEQNAGRNRKTTDLCNTIKKYVEYTRGL